jgi:hypothetical protein
MRDRAVAGMASLFPGPIGSALPVIQSVAHLLPEVFAAQLARLAVALTGLQPWTNICSRPSVAVGWHDVPASN